MKLVILSAFVLGAISANAGSLTAGPLNSVCQSLDASLEGSYTAELKFQNGSTSEVEVAFVRQSEGEFAATINDNKGTAKLVNDTAYGQETCTVMATGLTMTEVNPSLFEGLYDGTIKLQVTLSRH